METRSWQLSTLSRFKNVFSLNWGGKAGRVESFTGKNWNKNKIGVFFCSDLRAVQLEGACQLAEDWIGNSNLRAQGLLPCQTLAETGIPHCLLHPSPIGRNTLLFSCPVNSSSTRCQSSIKWTIPWMRIILVLCLRLKSWERKDLSARWQVLSSTPPGSFLFKFNFLPRRWSLWQFYGICISTFTTGN